MFTSINKALDASRLKREENQKGFTLIELLVVVIIIGILAAIAIPVFLNQRESAWKASVESDLKNAALVIETFGSQNNGSFTKLTEGVVTATSVVGTGSTTTYKFTNGNKLEVAKTGTPAGTSYTITGSNENITTGKDTLVYDSAAGGIQSWKE